MKELVNYFDQLGVEYDDQLIDKFKRYMEGVLLWNEKVNLTAIKDRQEFIKKHFVDSILAFKLEEMRSGERIIDVGTGGGFPGIPLALIFPEKEFVLMDSLQKRLKIIEQLCGEIGIKNVKTLHGRAEDLGRDKNHRHKYDVCVSRAVANLSTLCEFCLPFVKMGGYFLSYKGTKADQEVAQANSAIFLLGGKLKREEEIKLDNYDLSHRILIIEKVQNTSDKYPRKAGVPAKKPL